MSTDSVLLLVAEDEPLVALAAEEALRTGGFDLLVVPTGAAAIEVLETRSSELSGLITDIRFGSRPNGWEVARRARELVPSLPIVFMTGDSAHEWASRGVPKSVLVQKPSLMRN